MTIWQLGGSRTWSYVLLFVLNMGRAHMGKVGIFIWVLLESWSWIVTFESCSCHRARAIVPSLNRDRESCRESWIVVTFLRVYSERIRVYVYLSLKENQSFIKELEQIVLLKAHTIACNLHIKLHFSWNTWNDHTVTTVILPAALCSKCPLNEESQIRPKKQIRNTKVNICYFQTQNA